MEYTRTPAMYTPASIRAKTDFSEFYEKTPQEMSRYELEDLERIVREKEEGLDEIVDHELLEDEYDEDGNLID